MRTTPCRECPFRTTSLAGHVGEHANFNEILSIVHHDERFPCHMEVNHLRECEASFDDACDAAGTCVGSLAYMNNVAIPPPDELKEHADKAGRRSDVFQTPSEAMIYHDGKVTMIGPPVMLTR